MPVQNSPPARKTRSQAVLIPTSRVCFDGNPAVPQLRANFGRSSTIQDGRKRANKIKFIFRHQGKSCIHRWRLTSHCTAVSIKSCFSCVSVTL
ncbi:hypothetical protein O181_098864 [Austropuccinia psidii MF-1]|uniref:Uncharacterized protein n=1 Tax=Austropuccinia psidii MF-1 TaxID=1389203 RepID=A0A9Q3JC43_9BASI|nr:hypothetical protein [Austropuccinia psidii MF-1]